jgi:hypothetical protein
MLLGFGVESFVLLLELLPLELLGLPEEVNGVPELLWAGMTGGTFSL